MKRQVLEVLSGKGNTSALTTNDLFILVNETTEIIDIFVTGGTYSNGTATFTNNSGGTFNVTGFYIPSATTAYKVFTALLTQSGGSDVFNIQQNDGIAIVIGQTYQIVDQGFDYDFTVIGAPNNDFFTSFIATGTRPRWGDGGTLRGNNGAPVANVLENTIGNVWFEYSAPGEYYMNSNRLFTQDKVFTIVTNNTDLYDAGIFMTITLNPESDSLIFIRTGNVDGHYDEILHNTPIEIRVYN